MKNKDLIKKLQEFPDDMNVVIFDINMSLHHSDGSSVSPGIYSDVSVESIDLYKVDEFGELIEDELIKSVSIVIDNTTDYDDKGTRHE